MGTTCRLFAAAAIAVIVVLGTTDPPAGRAALPADVTPRSDRLAPRPPMGFNDWNAFGCDPSEQLVEQTADAMVASGMRDAGYDLVNVDDCWLAPARDAAGRLQPDPARFPHGIRAVAEYVHAKGMRFGIYEDAGTQTCAWSLNTALLRDPRRLGDGLVWRFPGSYGHEDRDARTFASWGVDYLKYDWCSVPFGDFPGLSHRQVARVLYGRMSDALRATGRPIVLSMCSGWDPAVVPASWARGVSDLWRTTPDIADDYRDMLDVFHANVRLAAWAGPGGWNDPDMLEVGNGGMSEVEDRSAFSLWAAMAAPLIAGTDVRRMSPATRAIYTNLEVIAVDQDPLGRQAAVVRSSGGRWVLSKPLANGDRAVVLFNETDAPAVIATTAGQVGLDPAPSYAVRDLWRHTTAGSAGAVGAVVGPHAVVAYRVAPATVPLPGVLGRP